jgi:hypothetical protein
MNPTWFYDEHTVPHPTGRISPAHTMPKHAHSATAIASLAPTTTSPRIHPHSARLTRIGRTLAVGLLGWVVVLAGIVPSQTVQAKPLAQHKDATTSSATGDPFVATVPGKSSAQKKKKAAAKPGNGKPEVQPGSGESTAQRDARLKRECKGRPNAGACLGYATL